MTLFRVIFAFLAVASSACELDATVGYNDGQLVTGRSCSSDALSRCEQDSCGVTKLFDAPGGAISLQADEADLFFPLSRLSIGRRKIADGTSIELAACSTPVMGMTSDSTHVYWLEQDGAVRGVGKRGDAPFDVSYVSGTPTDIALDATHLYWVLPQSGQVAMAPKPFGEATHIAGQDSPQGITTDGTHVYWVNTGSGAANGQLMRAKRGELTTAEVVLSDLEAPLSISAGDDAVYWASKTAVFKWPKGATTASTLARGFTEVKRLAAHGSTLYGIGMDGLWQVSTRGGAWQALEHRPMSALAVTCSAVYATHWLEDGLLRYGP